MEELIFNFQTAPVAAVIFVLTLITSLYAFFDHGAYEKMMLNPYRVSRGERVYSIITSGLIHADYIHLLFNMMSFWFFAFELERKMGPVQFGVLYVASLALSDLSTILRHRDDIWYNSLGASGAISAVIFGFILFSPLQGMGLIFLPGLSMPACIFGVLYLFYSAYAAKQSSHINHDAHFYGAISGLIITIMVVPGIIPAFIEQIRMALAG